MGYSEHMQERPRPFLLEGRRRNGAMPLCFRQYLHDQIADRQHAHMSAQAHAIRMEPITEGLHALFIVCHALPVVAREPVETDGQCALLEGPNPPDSHRSLRRTPVSTPSGQRKHTRYGR